MPQFVVARTIAALAGILDGLLRLYFWIVVIRAVLSWVNPDPRNPIVRFLYAVTEPVLYGIRRRLPFLQAGSLDLTPLALILGIEFARMVIVPSLFELAAQIGSVASRAFLVV